MSDESIKPLAASNNNLSLALSYIYTKLQANFDENFSKQKKVTFTHKKVVNIHIVNEINLRLYTQGADFTLDNSLFRGAKVTENVDPDK